MATVGLATRSPPDFHTRIPPMSTLVERVTASKPDTNVGDRAARQPSQQDLEIARQLQNFHEQNSLPIARDDESLASETAHSDTQHETKAHSQRNASPTASDRSDQRLPSPNPALTGQVCT